jgi:Cu(I)/Ag(I) efflux system protein CusF
MPADRQVQDKVMMRRDSVLALAALAVASASAAPALAWDAVHPTGEVVPIGRVVKVDTDAGKITIEHKPIWRFYMEAMTMTFKVSDSAMLAGLTPGDRIRFKVERTSDGFVVTWIENTNL